MAKIDFVRVEQHLGEALQHWFVKKLVEGQSVTYMRASSYFGSETAKPGPEDSVIVALKEWEQEVQEEEKEEDTTTQPKEPEEIAPSPQASIQSIPIEAEATPEIPPLFILRKRLLWFIRNHVVNIYKLLGTTKEEIIALRKKSPLTPEDDKRIQELLVKSTEINQRLMKKLGIDSDDALIESEKKRHLTKRFNIRETWLPL
jgi:hypothetical protein